MDPTAATRSPAPWTATPALESCARACGPRILHVRAADGTRVAILEGGDGRLPWPGAAEAEANARRLAAAPELEDLVREGSAPGGIGPLESSAFRARCLAALARVDDPPPAAVAPAPGRPPPSRHELAGCLRALVRWAGLMGGWDAEAWRDAERLVRRMGERS